MLLKLSGEYALFNAYQEHKLPFVIARIHNVYGPRMGLNHFFSDFINRCLSGEFTYMLHTKLDLIILLMIVLRP